ncbi:MAG: ATP synthase F1 subunit epsilon [Oscillospiraceae bacterium]|nr:ATP synthase F1 subunit epsilon [Oscillospiraceae bacterium]MBR4194344.1 ATP synthase F1 subunit epsilon [Oscillospiraceae bacterium]
MTFQLQVVTPDGLAFDGEAEKLSVRTQDGIIGILPRHIDYVAPLGMGEAVITESEGRERRAACIGGMVAVHSGKVRLVATTFEWAEDIDMERAKTAEQKARDIIARNDLNERDLKLAEAKLHRALVRQAVRKRI